MKKKHLFNTLLRLRYFPKQWKLAEIITIPKPGKSLYEVISYRPISLVSIISKVLEKLLIKRFISFIVENHLLLEHQFGFRDKDSTIDRVYYITDMIELALEDKKLCLAVLFDVSQVFDRVWQEELIYKLKSMLPESFSNLLELYLQNRCFRLRYEFQSP